MANSAGSQTLDRLVLAQFVDRMAFARVSDELTLLECSDNWATVLPAGSILPTPGTTLAECFEEFFGLESYLNTIMQSRRPMFRIERVNRGNPTEGKNVYFDFSLARIENSEELLLTVENSSEFGRLEQTVVQERNELRLTRLELAKANEALRRLDRFKSLFFAMAAHDLRSPLMTVRGYADLLGIIVNQSLEGDIAERSREFIETIKVQADWLDKMIYNILELNRIETGDMLMENELCNALDLVRHAGDSLRPMAALSEQALELNLPPNGVLINGDPHRIEQCVINLISNAVKYTQPGGTITVSLQHSGDIVEISVSDNGRGMNADQLEHVFDLYYRTQDARQSAASGTGLGLFVVKSIVEAHNGEISVTSGEGEGATFLMRFPAYVGQPESDLAN